MKAHTRTKRINICFRKVIEAYLVGPVRLELTIASSQTRRDSRYPTARNIIIQHYTVFIK